MKRRALLEARLFGVPHLIEPTKLDVIADILTRPRAWQDDSSDHPEASAAPKVRSGIAVLPVHGTLVSRGSFVDAMSGLTSYDAIRGSLRAALADPAVRGILLDVDSPGGEAARVFDLADAIRAASAQKPVWAVADDMAASAAYALASAAEQLWISRAGLVGSIGVRALFRDQSAHDEAEGYRFTSIHAGARKNDLDPHAPLTDHGRAALQGEVDRIYGLFVDQVARHRGVKAEAVRGTEAALLRPEDAITLGLADRIGTPDDALAAMAERLSSRPAMSAGHNGTRTKRMDGSADQPGAQTGDRQDNVVDLEAARREAHGAGAAEAHAYVGEVMDLCALAGQPQLAAELIKAKTPVAQVRQQLLQARSAQAAGAAAAVGTLHMPGAAASSAADNHGWDNIMAKAAPHRFAARR